MREYFYEVDLKGRLTHDGTELIDPAFLDFFFKQIKANDTGIHPDFAFVSPCGNEMSFVRPADSPIVCKSLKDGKLIFAGNLSVEFDVHRLTFHGESIYHPVDLKFGTVSARLGPQVILDLSGKIEKWGPYYSFSEPHATGIPRVHVIEPRDGTLSDFVILRPGVDAVCFVCGPSNEKGMVLPFLYDKKSGEAYGWMTGAPWMVGHPERMHGGFISLLLDEVMAKVLLGLGLRGFTANLNVDFRKPCPVNQRIKLRGWLSKSDGRKFFLNGEIIDDATGQVLCEGSSLYIKF